MKLTKRINAYGKLYIYSYKNVIRLKRQNFIQLLQKCKKAEKQKTLTYNKNVIRY